MFALILIWKVKGEPEMFARRCFRVPLMQQQCEDPCLSTHVPIMSNLLPIVCTHVQIPFETGNLMVIVMNVDLWDQKGRKTGDPERRRGLFRCSGVVGFHEERWFGETWLFFPSAFPRTQGSRLLQEDRALPRHTSLEGFLQATSRLFGCHWDCLKRICFCTVLQGAPHQEKSRSPLSTWHCCYAFVNIKAKRLGQCV